MTDAKTTTPALDAKLQSMFREMRDAEGGEAPQFPLPADLPEPVVAARFGPPRKLAAGLAAAMVAAVLVVPTQPSPDDLYLDVMSDSALLTDDLLLASPVLLPELNDFAEMYEIPETVESIQWN